MSDQRYTQEQLTASDGRVWTHEEVEMMARWWLAKPEEMRAIEAAMDKWQGFEKWENLDDPPAVDLEIQRMRGNKPDQNPKTGQGRKKPNLTLVPPSSIIYMSTAFMDGAEKYGPYNWRKTGVSMMVYLRALNSHYQLFLDGEDHDPKTKVHHLAYVMANCAIILDGMTKEGVMVDDRPPPGAAAELTKRFMEHGHLMPSPSLVQRDSKIPREVLLKAALARLAMKGGNDTSTCLLCDTTSWSTKDGRLAHKHEKYCLLWEGPGNEQR